MSGVFCSQESDAVDQLGFGLGWLLVSVTFLTVVTKMPDRGNLRKDVFGLTG